MRVISYVEVKCDDCGKALRVKAPWPTQDRLMARKRLMRQMERMAARHGWRMEGPSPWAGDLCDICSIVENRLVNSQLGY